MDSKIAKDLADLQQKVNNNEFLIEAEKVDEWGGGVLAGDTASAGSAPLLSVQVASGTESDRLLSLRFFM